MSVIIPTFNRKNMLSETIASVLSQSMADIEIIIVDDMSTDDTASYVRNIPDKRIRYFTNTQKRSSEGSRNFGLNQASGKYIVFIDDDDYYTDCEFFAKALKIFADSEKPLAIVCADGDFLETETGKSSPHYPGDPGHVNGTEYILKQEREYFKPTSLFPAVFDGEILRRSGLCGMKIFDTETYLWAALHGDVYIMPGIVGVYRLHPESNTMGRKNSPEWMSKRMHNLASRIHIDREIWRRLCERSSRIAASRWYMKMIELQIRFFTGNADRSRDDWEIFRTILRESGNVPELWLMMPYFVLKFELRRAEFLRKVYHALT